MPYLRYLLIDDESLMLRSLRDVFIATSFSQERFPDALTNPPRRIRKESAIGTSSITITEATLDDVTVEVYEATTRGEADDVISNIKLDACSCDLYLDSESHVEGLSIIRLAASKEIRTLVISSAQDPQTVLACATAGADSYLVKKYSAEHIERGIAYFIGGGDVWPTSALRWLETEARLPVLMEEYGRVLNLLANGGTTKSMAKALEVSETQMETQLSAIYSELGVTSGKAAVKLYMKHLMGANEPFIIAALSDDEANIDNIAGRHSVNPNTGRSTLSRFYKKLGAETRGAAAAKLQVLGLLTSGQSSS